MPTDVLLALRHNAAIFESLIFRNGQTLILGLAVTTGFKLDDLAIFVSDVCMIGATTEDVLHVLPFCTTPALRFYAVRLCKPGVGPYRARQDTMQCRFLLGIFLV